jgi:hypothetical protein
MKNWLISGRRAVSLLYIFLLVQSFLVASSDAEPEAKPMKPLQRMAVTPVSASQVEYRSPFSSASEII